MENAPYIIWNINPELLALGPITVRWYGLFFVLSFIIGFIMMRWIFQRENKPISDIDSLLIYVMLGTIVGARLGHCFFYDPLYYLNNPFEILKVWKGGLASHGGAVGVFAALLLYTRDKPNQPYLWLLDRITMPTILCACFVRLGNLFNSEIIGIPTTLPWAFVFEKVDDIPRHPVQLYESITYGVIFILLLVFYRKFQGKLKRGILSGVFLVSVFTARFLLEFMKTRQASYGYDLTISVGQWLSIPLVIAGTILLVRTYTQKSSKYRAL